MVRSNFDYTNRSSAGEKLGTFIATDLHKKAAQVLKPTKAPPKNGSSGRNDTCISNKPIAHTKFELKVPDKLLTDAGLEPIAEALTALLKARPDLVLTELILSGNALTYCSLRFLAPVLRQSPELTLLDLSKNAIMIKEDASVEVWQEFTWAFWGIPEIAKLDLSENHSLGGLAFEYLARLASTKAMIAEVNMPKSIQSKENVNPVVKRLPPSKPSKAALNRKAPSNPSPATTSGFSSTEDADELCKWMILDVRNVHLTGYGIVFASAIMLPKSITAPHIVVEWGEAGNILGKDSIQLLESLEMLQQLRLKAHRIAAVAAFAALVSATEGGEQDLTDDLAEDDDEEVDVAEDVLLEGINRTVKKLQRSIIIDHGYGSVELWAAAMKVFTVSRQVYILAIGLQKLQESDPYVRHTTTAASRRPSRLRVTNALRVNGRSGGGSSDAVTSPTPGHSARVKELVDSMRDTNVLRISDINANRGIITSDVNGKAAAAAKLGGISTRMSQGPPQLRKWGPVMTQRAARMAPKYLEWQKRWMSDVRTVHGGASDGYRDPSLKCQLPLPVCSKILSFATEISTRLALSERQCRKVFEWGQLNDTLKTEYDWRNKDKASQIWMLLEAMECLEYDQIA